MEYDKKTIDIPEGYEIDIEETKKQKGVVVLRKQLRPTNCAELLKMCKGKESFLYSAAFGEVVKGEFEGYIGFGEFEDKETAEAFAALWTLLNYRKAWIGDWKPDWMDLDADKFVIVVNKNEITNDTRYFVSCPLSFPTKEMRDDFYKSFKDLLEVAKPLL